MKTIESVMSPNIHSIGIGIPLLAAEEQMRKFQVRHLPVLEGGKIMGMLSDRDIKLMKKFPGFEAITVGEAMSPDPYVVSRSAAIREVAAAMAERKLGSAVVAEKGKILGIFTAVDGMKLLAELCG